MLILDCVRALGDKLKRSYLLWSPPVPLAPSPAQQAASRANGARSLARLPRRQGPRRPQRHPPRPARRPVRPPARRGRAVFAEQHAAVTNDWGAARRL